MGQRLVASVPLRRRGVERRFHVGRHALCWIHAERLVHKLDTFTDKQRVAQVRVRGLIWNLCGSQDL